MDELSHQLALHLLSCDERWTDRRRLNVAVSTLMMVAPGIDLLDAASKGLEKRRYAIDSRLIASFYTNCPPNLKLALASTAAFSWLEPSAFKRLFRDAWQIKPLTTAQRRNLASSLAAFLYNHPERAHDYEDLILTLAWSRAVELHLTGVHLIRYLDYLSPEDITRLKRRLSSPLDIRMNALNAVCALLKRYREISPELLAFCTSEEVKQIARRIYRTDSDRDARTCAYYLLKALRQYDRGEL